MQSPNSSPNRMMQPAEQVIDLIHSLLYGRSDAAVILGQAAGRLGRLPLVDERARGG